MVERTVVSYNGDTLGARVVRRVVERASVLLNKAYSLR